MATYSPIFSALKGMGIGTGKGSQKWKADFRQALKDNNIKSVEDISALTQHIENKFSAAKSGKILDDGRFEKILSDTGLNYGIYNAGVASKTPINLKRTPIEESKKSERSRISQLKHRINAAEKDTTSAVMQGKTYEQQYKRDLERQFKNRDSSKILANKLTQRREALQYEDEIRGSKEFQDAMKITERNSAMAQIGKEFAEQENNLSDQQIRFAQGIVDTNSFARSGYRAKRAEQAEEIGKARENRQGKINVEREERRLESERAQLALRDRLKTYKEGKAYWNDEARVKSLERSYASALRRLDEEGTVVDQKNLFYKLSNDETARAQLQRYNPELYEKLGFKTKGLEEDLAEQEAYQSPFNIKNTYAATSVEDAQRQIGADAYMREMSGEAGVEDIKFAQDYMAEHESARAGYESAKSKAATNKQIEQKQIQSKAMAGLDEDTKKEIDEGGLGHFMVNGELNEAKITQNVSRNTDRNNSWIPSGAHNNAVTHRGKSITEYGNTRLKEIENDSSLDAIQKEQEKIKLQLDIKNQTEQGPGIADYIFGNKVHTGAIGVAALTATYGVAFGGHKSNAELYGSPF